MIKKSSKIKSKYAYIMSVNNRVLIGNGQEFIEIDRENLVNHIKTNNIIKLIGFDMKKIIKIFVTYGYIKFKNIEFFDIKLAWYTYNPNLQFETLTELAKYLGTNKIQEVYHRTMKQTYLM